MEIQELSEAKQLLIWLTKADMENEEIMSEANRIRNTYKANNWLVITYKSGTENSFKCIVDLLRYNRDRLIAQESEGEQDDNRPRYSVRPVY